MGSRRSLPRRAALSGPRSFDVVARPVGCFPRVMRLPPGAQTKSYRIFLSSGIELRSTRDRVTAWIHDVFNSQLVEAGSDVRLDVDRWEFTPAHLTAAATTNQQFVDRAVSCHLALVLLHNHLGPGTREEFEALLDDDRFRSTPPELRPEVSAIWFEPTSKSRTGDIRAFLDDHRDAILYNEAGAPRTEDATRVLTRVLLRAVLTALTESATP
jgi:hypothetical protein